MKIIVASLLALTLLTGGALAAFVGMAPQTAGTTAMAIPATSFKVGATAAPSVYVVDTDAQQKWTLDQRGLTSESLQTEMHDGCGLNKGLSAHSRVD